MLDGGDGDDQLAGSGGKDRLSRDAGVDVAYRDPKDSLVNVEIAWPDTNPVPPGLAALLQEWGDEDPPVDTWDELIGDVLDTSRADIVRFRLAVTDLDGRPLPGNTVTVGETFQLHGYVQDVRLDGGANPPGSPTGVFAGYMDVLMTNANLASIRCGETQDLRMDATRPGPFGTPGPLRSRTTGRRRPRFPT